MGYCVVEVSKEIVLLHLLVCSGKEKRTMTICVGSQGCGKTLLIKSLAANAEPGSVTKHAASVPTTGSNIVAVKKSKGDDQNTPPDVVSLREVGGSMAPLWKNMIESGKTQIIYCVDASSPERIGAATINLVELLHQPALQSAPVLILFTKTDLKSARSITELKSLMRLEDIRQHSGQDITVLEWTTEDKEKISPVLDWCLKF